jgi:hypothetical protein
MKKMLIYQSDSCVNIYSLHGMRGLLVNAAVMLAALRLTTVLVWIHLANGTHTDFSLYSNIRSSLIISLVRAANFPKDQWVAPHRHILAGSFWVVRLIVLEALPHPHVVVTEYSSHIRVVNAWQHI